MLIFAFNKCFQKNLSNLSLKISRWLAFFHSKKEKWQARYDKENDMEK